MDDQKLEFWSQNDDEDSENDTKNSILPQNNDCKPTTKNSENVKKRRLSRAGSNRPWKERQKKKYALVFERCAELFPEFEKIPDVESDDIHEITQSCAVTIKFLMRRRLLRSECHCPHAQCRKNPNAWLAVRRRPSPDQQSLSYYLRCKKCSGTWGILKDSFFLRRAGQEKMHLHLRLIYMWAYGLVDVSEAVSQTGLAASDCKDVQQDLRLLCQQWVTMYPPRLGGPGKLVQLGSRWILPKSKNGEGCTVLCGLDIEMEQCFVMPFDTKSIDTFLEAIRAHIVPGSIIRSDLWSDFDVAEIPDALYKTYRIESIDKSVFCASSVQILQLKMSETMCEKFESSSRGSSGSGNETRNAKNINAALAELVWRQNCRVEPFNCLLAQIGQLFSVDSDTFA